MNLHKHKCYVGWKAAQKPSAINFNRTQKVPWKLKREVFDYNWTNWWNFHLKLNFLKQFVRSERASEVLISVLQQIYALGESFQVRSLWTFVKWMK